MLVVVGGFAFSRLPIFTLPDGWLACLALLLVLGLRVNLIIAALACGGLIAGLAISSQQADRWPTERWNEAINAQFQVSAFPEVHGARQSLWLEPIARPDLPQRLRVNWYHSNQRPGLGESWSLRVRLRSPRGLANPGWFDYERYLFGQQVGATGYIVAGPHNHRITAASISWISRWRRGLLDTLEEGLPAGSIRAIAVALSLGTRAQFEHHVSEVFASTGTSHLMAISGLHVGLVAGLVSLLMRIPCRLLGGWRRRPVSRYWIAIPALAAAIAYSAVAGFGVPTQRACIMLGFALLSWASGRRLLALEPLAYALLAVFLLDPLLVFQVGGFLSFSAVACLRGLVWRDRASRQRSGKISTACRWQLWLSLWSLPMTLLLFGLGALLGPVANLLLIPWFSLCIVPLLALTLLLSPFGCSQWLWTLLEHSIGGALRLLTWLAGLDFAVLTTAGWTVFAAWTATIAFVTASIVIYSPWRLALIGGAVIVALPTGEPRPALGCLRMTMFDVGQGQAALIQTTHSDILYDTGPALPDGGSIARTTLIPALKYIGARPEVIIVSHADADHAGGFADLLEAYPDARVYRSDLTGPYRCARGEGFKDGQFEFRFLAPNADQLSQRAGNPESCVLQVIGPAGEGIWLGTGDITVHEEWRLVRSDHPLASTVVLVPHHGSATSSSKLFADAVAARQAWVAAGFRNRWSFPKPSVVKHWEQSGAKLQVVGDQGALRAQWCDGQLTQDRPYRAKHPELTRLPPELPRP